MRAWSVTTVGNPSDALSMGETDIPQIRKGGVLVKVQAAALNFPDLLMCRGEYQVRPELPFTPGMEICGEVVEVGEDVTDVAIGDRVMGAALLPHGGFAEYALIDKNVLFKTAASLTSVEASVMSLSYQTGWFALHRRANLQAGETLLVHAAAGGVGSAAVQLGKAAGAQVIAVVGNHEKAQAAEKLGADLVIDRNQEDFVATVMDFTGGRGVDVIYDPVGGDAYKKSTKCIGFEGRIVIIGFASGEIPAPPLNHALVKNYSIMGLYWGAYNMARRTAVHDAHNQIVDLVEKDGLRPLIGGEIAFEDLADGLNRLGRGEIIGRAVLLPPDAQTAG